MTRKCLQRIFVDGSWQSCVLAHGHDGNHSPRLDTVEEVQQRGSWTSRMGVTTSNRLVCAVADDAIYRLHDAYVDAVQEAERWGRADQRRRLGAEAAAVEEQLRTLEEADPSVLRRLGLVDGRNNLKSHRTRRTS